MFQEIVRFQVISDQNFCFKTKNYKQYEERIVMTSLHVQTNHLNTILGICRLAELFSPIQMIFVLKKFTKFSPLNGLKIKNFRNFRNKVVEVSIILTISKKCVEVKTKHILLHRLSYFVDLA